MEKLRLHLHALISGLLLSVAWMEWGTGLSLFIAFVPLFMVEQFILREGTSHSGSRMFFYSLEALLIWNIIATWWIGYATFFGAVAAIIINASLFTSILWLYHQTHKATNQVIAFAALICYWTGFEYFYLNAEISWPWLNLGNGFANNIHLIQWYEYTGTLGGTIWVLIINILIFRVLDIKFQNLPLKQRKPEIIALPTILLFPMLISWILFATYKEKPNPRTVVVVQPNIDPYNEKFDGLSWEEQLNRMLSLAAQKTDKQTDYVVFPETAIDNGIWEEFIEDNESIRQVRSFMRNYPHTCLISGIFSHRMYIDSLERSYTAQYNKQRGFWYDSFNSSMQVDSTSYIPIYHKSKLVVGVEMLPYPKYMRFLSKYAIDLGGTFGSLGTQETRDVFVNPKDSTKVGTAICYESIYGEFFSGYVKNGANLMFVITNDGWWRDTPGYKQHHSYSRLRAIETRRDIARSANTGRSSFINQRGEVLQSTTWWKQDVIKATLNANDKLTFYTRHGDYLGRLCLFLSALIGLYAMAQSLFLKPRKHQA
jgi:apolipoprotein N-acyltransferase